MKARHEISSIDQRNGMLKKYLLPMLGDRYLDEITPSDISDVLDALQQRKLAANTLLSYYGLLHLLFDLASELDLIEHNPVRPKMHWPRLEATEKPTLTPEQIRRIADHLDAQERLFVLLLGVTGLRSGEARARRWQDINEAESTLTVTHTLYKGELKRAKTKASQAVMPLHPIIVGMLMKHKLQSPFQSPGDFIFYRPGGSPLADATMRLHLYEAMDKLGIGRKKWQFGFHLLRHSAATLLYEKLCDVKLVQAVLQHSKVATTADIYVHPGQVIGAEAVDVLTKSLFGENCDKIVSQTSELVS